MRALVLAGSRGGTDPVAAQANVPYKCLAPVAGRPMIEHVLDALLAVPEVEGVRVVVNDPSCIVETASLRHPAVDVRSSPPTPSMAVAEAFEELGAPLLVTTADHPLLTPELLSHFLAASAADSVDLSVGLVSSTVILAQHPNSVRTYLKFRDGSFSGANLFLLKTPQAISAVRFWRRVEAERKRPWRIAKAFGLPLLLGYLVRAFTLDQALERASKVVDARAGAVRLPFAEAAIDVDKPSDLALAEQILARRAAT